MQLKAILYIFFTKLNVTCRVSVKIIFTIICYIIIYSVILYYKIISWIEMLKKQNRTI